MNPVIGLVMLTGAACSSPLEHAPRETVAYQVPCAIAMREQTGNPFKVAQEPNTITPAAAKPAPKFKYPPKKKAKKKKRKSRR